jgi:hypothetical protein
MTFHWFATDMSVFRTLDQREVMSVMFRFVEDSSRADLEQVACLLMPVDFMQRYIQKRLATDTKEAWRRTFVYYIGHRLDGKIAASIHQNGQISPVELAVIDYVRAHGAFQMANLGAALGHPPTPDDIKEVTHFLGLMTDRKWQRILSDAGKHRLDMQ